MPEKYLIVDDQRVNIETIKKMVDDKYMHINDNNTISFQTILLEPKGQKTTTLLTGCPRTGTRKISMLLRELGLDIRHERIRKSGCVSWQHGSPGEHGIEADKTIMVTRNPIDNISSMATVFNKSGFTFMFHELGLTHVLKEDDITKAMYAYYYWNRAILRRNPTYIFKIEELKECFPIVAMDFGLSSNWHKLNELDYESKVNSKAHKQLSWNTLKSRSESMVAQIEKLAVDLGY